MCIFFPTNAHLEYGFTAGQRPCCHQNEWHHHLWARSAWFLLWVSASGCIQGYKCSISAYGCPIMSSIIRGSHSRKTWSSEAVIKLLFLAGGSSISLLQQWNQILWSWGDGEHQTVPCFKKWRVLPNSEFCSGFGFYIPRNYTGIVILKTALNNTFGNKYSMKSPATKITQSGRLLQTYLMKMTVSLFLMTTQNLLPPFLCFCFRLLLVI